MKKSLYYNYEIFDPLFKTKEGITVGIYDKRINTAIRNRQLFRVKCGNVEKIFYPKWIKKNCKTFQKVYLRPNEPMTEYEVFLAYPKKLSQEEKVKKMCLEGVFS